MMNSQTGLCDQTSVSNNCKPKAIRRNSVLRLPRRSLVVVSHEEEEEELSDPTILSLFVIIFAEREEDILRLRPLKILTA
jgi:hypothetical protein